MAGIKHPAKYSDLLLPILSEILLGYEKICDPFGGTGKIFELEKYLPNVKISAVEIEKEWQELNPRTTLGDALDLPWPDSYFDAICTSPTWANRMADHHFAKDNSKRNTYTHTLGRQLSPNNSGKLQWGAEYRKFHYKAWQEVWRVLRPGGRFALNISDHIRKGKIVRVARFHKLLCLFMGFELTEAHMIRTPRQRQGENSKLRVEYEWVYVFDKK